MSKNKKQAAKGAAPKDVAKGKGAQQNPDQDKIELQTQTAEVKKETVSLYRTSKLNRQCINQSRAHRMDDLIEDHPDGITAQALTESGREISSVRSHLNSLQRQDKIVRLGHLYFSKKNFNVLTDEQRAAIIAPKKKEKEAAEAAPAQQQ